MNFRACVFAFAFVGAVACISSQAATNPAGMPTAPLDADIVAEDAGVDVDAVVDAPDRTCDPLGARSPGLSLFIGPEGLETRFVAAIDGAKRSVRVAMYEFDVESIVAALGRAVARGCNVQVIVDREKGVSAVEPLAKLGVDARPSSSEFSFFHAKVLVVDDAISYVSSANFNSYSMQSERNYGVVDSDPQDVGDLVRLFERDFGGSGVVDLACSRLIVSPANARSRLIPFISSAQSELRLGVMYLQDKEALAAVIARAKAGVSVKVLLADPGWLSQNTETAEALRAGGIETKFLRKIELHAKLVVADGAAFVGSQNLSFTSLDRNREIGVVTAEPDVVTKAKAQFDEDWNAAEP